MDLDDSWKQLQQVNEIVRYADAKAGLILTLNGVLIGLVAVRLQSGGFFADHPVPAGALVIAGGLLTISLGFDIAAVMPRLIAPGQRVSLLHFDHVAVVYAGRVSDFIDDFVTLAHDPEELQRDIAAQVWANSMVARRKHRCVQWGLRLLGAALAVVLFAAVVGAFGG
jgi:pycsar effector protein